MVLKYFIIFFFFLQVIDAGRRAATHKRHAKSFNFRENSSLKFSPFDIQMNDHHRGNKRHRRCLSSAMALLWPQVVGPVEQGIIDEKSFDDVPKTPIEYRLDRIREKARQEEERRLLIRDYIKSLTEAQDKFYGPPSYGQTSYLETNLV